MPNVRSQQLTFRTEALLLAWILVFGLAWVDALDLTDDTLLSHSNLTQALETDLDDSKVPAPVFLTTLDVEHLASANLTWHVLAAPAAFPASLQVPHVPVYQEIRTYRI
jgi:hypothetical protein